MADTRCANPEYQLEVDTMMLDYTLYRAIESLLEVLKPQLGIVDGDSHGDELPGSDSATNGTSLRDVDATQAVRQVTRLAHDVYVHHAMFQQHHAISDLDAGPSYSLTLFKLLSMLVHWMRNSPHIESSRDLDGLELLPADDPTRRHRRVLNAAMRRRWLRIRNEKASHGTELVNEIASMSSCSSSAMPVELEEPLSLFMVISYRMATAMGEINHRWMSLAIRFMLYAALEKIEMLQASDHATHEGGSAKVRDIPLAKDAIEGCFAWGYVNASVSSDNAYTQHLLDELSRMDAFADKSRSDLEQITAQHMAMTDKIISMFAPSPDEASADNDDDGDVDMEDTSSGNKEEIPAWTTARQHHLSTLLDLAVSTHGSENASRSRNSPLVSPSALARFNQEYPFDTFMVDLLQYIEGIFRRSSHRDIHGKPVLVQIEEGGLEGLTRSEFQEFLARCGLKETGVDGPDGTVRTGIKWRR